MTVFFTADTHFGHARIIDFMARPFRDLEDMDRSLIDRWNARVAPDDTVYHLGDFAWGSARAAAAVLAALNGRKTLIAGNHDHSRTRALDGWEQVTQILEVEHGGVRLALCHYPMLEWPGAWKGVLHLFGHVHGRIPALDRRCDVGVDVWDFAPVTLPEIQARLASAPAYTPTDAHAAA